MRVGIDLGTVNSVVARIDQSIPDAPVVANARGLLLTPTVVSISDGEATAGCAAFDRLVSDEPGCITDFKGRLGRDAPIAMPGGCMITGEDLCAVMFRALSEEAVESAGEEIEEAVITVPAYFDNNQRESARRAAESAGINVVRILDEPVAAAICCCHYDRRSRRVLVFDLGGGTLDLSICDVRGSSIDVIANSGDLNLGGNDWDAELLRYASSLFARDFGMDPDEDDSVRESLLHHAESYKRLLSENDHVNYEIEYRGKKGTYRITREDFEEVTSSLLDSAMDTVRRFAIGGKSLRPADIDSVLLVGGASRMPCIARALESMGFSDIDVPDPSLMDTAVARGAAFSLLRDVFIDGSMEVRECMSLSVGLLTRDENGSSCINSVVVPRGSPYPASGAGRLRIRENNLTDHLDVIVLQGESQEPADCTVIARKTVTGFRNTGAGLIVDVALVCDTGGRVAVSASCDGTDLRVEDAAIPPDAERDGVRIYERRSDLDVRKEVLFCIDLSRSTRGCLDGIRREVEATVEKLDERGTTFTLVGFADRCTVLCGPGAAAEGVVRALDGMSDDVFRKVGNGTVANPMECIYELMSGVEKVRLAIILTDGIWECRDDAVGYARLCRGSRIQTYAVSYGDRTDVSFLKQIATLEKDAVFTAVEDLGAVMDTIAVAIQATPTGLTEAGY